MAERGIERLNSLTHDEAEGELLKCCGSTAWACAMSASRPFGDADELGRAADEVWSRLERDDWLEAFSRHPKIGEREAAAGQSRQEQGWSSQEQSGVGGSGEAARAELAELNREYEVKFGHVFLICATGKSADEMLADLRERLRNEPEDEIKRAAEEQRLITRLRLGKLLDGWAQDRGRSGGET
ncbi:MAG: 2-oxo-4-hydroxy-4-carboxy-5-ureidoimidazoline decarboxylase [Acidobacteria bacterium]|nr:2-oxo-4-hydroxy-4-carboxy-5-ureidoimidazoline decarboxylase [Acidobacteriota bacterium]